jgi:fibronectin type 3 domain-containing protein
VSWLDEDASAGALYTYQVCATTAEGGGACASTTGTSSPTDLAATYNAETGVTLSWTDNSTDEAGFRIMRRTSAASTMTRIDTVAADEESYVNAIVESGTTYYYKVCAYDTGVTNCGAVAPVVVP